MDRRGLFVIAVIATAAAAQPMDLGSLQVGAAESTDLELLRSGAGQSPVLDVCSQFASELTGNYFCLRGDGTQVAAPGMTLSPVGSPTTVTPQLAGNGAGDVAVISRSLTASDYYATATSTPVPTDFSMFATIRAFDISTAPAVIARWDSTTGSPMALLNVNSGGSVSCTVGKAASTTTGIASAAASVVVGALHSIVCTYDFVADGSSVLRLYVDGVAATPSTTAVGPPVSNTLAWTVGAKTAGGNPLKGWILNAGVTEKVLNPTTIAAMASAAIPSFAGSRGEADTFARAAAKSCTAPDGTIWMQPSGRTCVIGGAYDSESNATNLLFQSEDFTTAWSAVGTPDLSGGSVNGWDFGIGSATGEILTDNDAAAREGVTQRVTTSTTGSWTGSCYVQAGTASILALTLTVNGGTGTTECDFTGLTSTTSRQTCTITAGAGITSIDFALKVGSVVGTTGTVKVSGCQLETGPIATSYIPTVGTTTSRGSDDARLAMPAGISTTEGCARFCFAPNWTGPNPTGSSLFILALNDVNTFRPGYIPTGGQTMAMYDGVSVPQAATTFTAGVRRCYLATWSANNSTKTITEIGGTAASSGFTAMGAKGATVWLGQAGGSGGQPYGRISDVRLGSSPTECN